MVPLSQNLHTTIFLVLVTKMNISSIPILREIVRPRHAQQGGARFIHHSLVVLYLQGTSYRTHPTPSSIAYNEPEQ